MAEIEILPQKIVKMKTIILKSRLDSNMVEFQGEKLKTCFFTRFGFLKPKSNEILLVAFSKYYEPYIVIGGKYSIDYCRKHDYALKVEDRAQALFIHGKKLKPELISLEEKARLNNVVGVEHCHYKKETYFILDRMLQEVSSNNLFLAPFEDKYETQPPVDLDLRKPQISLEEEITFLRSKLAKRPADVAEIIRENFEIRERTIIFSPIYELTYKNMKNGKTVTALIDGITGGVLIGKFNVKSSKKIGSPLASENLPVIQRRFFQVEKEQFLAYGDMYVSDLPLKNRNANLIIEEKVNNITADSPQPANSFQSNVEKSTNVATDFTARLGCKQGQFPTKMYVCGETDVVKFPLQEGNARVHIEPKTKEVEDNTEVPIENLEVIPEEENSEEGATEKLFENKEADMLSMLEALGGEERTLIAEKSQLLNMEETLKQRIIEEIEIKRHRIENLKYEIPELKQRCEALAKALDIPVQK